MIKYIITNLTEASLLFNTIESAQNFANKNNNLHVVAAYYSNEHLLPKQIGYGVANEEWELL